MDTPGPVINEESLSGKSEFSSPYLTGGIRTLENMQSVITGMFVDVVSKCDKL
jgi:hypothetical protein